jgi:hypothetical protein
MKRILLIALCATIVAACSKEEEQSLGGEIVDVSIELCIIDKDSNDLLNPANANGYKLADIGLYKNRELTEKRPKLSDWVYEEIAENKNRDDDVQLLFCDNCKIKYYLRFFAPPYDNEMKRDGKTIRYATSYLKLNASTIDTIYTEITMGDHSFLSKLEYNGEDITKTMVVKK